VFQLDAASELNIHTALTNLAYLNGKATAEKSRIKKRTK
jgi:hypothetical protein